MFNVAERIFNDAELTFNNVEHTSQSVERRFYRDAETFHCAVTLKHLGDLEHFPTKHLGDLEHFRQKHLGDLESFRIFALKINNLWEKESSKEKSMRKCSVGSERETVVQLSCSKEHAV